MEMAKQVGAIPVRKGSDGQLEVLLVTSRDTGRWIIPKGWTSKRLTDSEAAAREARQEAGVSGKISSKPIGGYRYRKLEADGGRMVDVAVFLLTVKKEKSRWSEQDQRERAWFDVKAAARRVREARLADLIRSLS
ncbi:MAG: NUDIX hydrolase [Hyphomicrobium sp.]|nr:NUDIX hydrolase [Hyphomicrobium sp.]